MLDPVKIEHFRNLVSLAVVDGRIDPIEKVALSKIAYEHGIPLDRLNVMLERASEYIYLIPQNQEDKERQLEDMIKFALVDGEFSPAELELINVVAGKLGISKDEVDKIIVSVVSKEDEQ